MKNPDNPRTHEVAQSFHFRTRSQKSGESVSDWLLALKTFKFTVIMVNTWIRRYAIDLYVGWPILMFKKACSIAETMEMADRNTQEFHPSSTDTI